MRRNDYRRGIRFDTHPYNTRSYRRYYVSSLRDRRAEYVEVTWIGGGYNTTYGLTVKRSTGATFPEYVCQLQSGCRTLAEVIDECERYFRGEAKTYCPAP